MLCVLIIADDPEMREMLKTYFSLKDGLTARAERTVAGGLKRIMQEEFDFVVAALHRNPAGHRDIVDLMETHCPEASLLLVAKGACPPALRAALVKHGWTYLTEPVAMHRFGDLIRKMENGNRRMSTCSAQKTTPLSWAGGQLSPSCLQPPAQRNSRGQAVTPLPLRRK